METTTYIGTVDIQSVVDYILPHALIVDYQITAYTQVSTFLPRHTDCRCARIKDHDILGMQLVRGGLSVRRHTHMNSSRGLLKMRVYW